MSGDVLARRRQRPEMMSSADFNEITRQRCAGDYASAWSSASDDMIQAGPSPGARSPRPVSAATAGSNARRPPGQRGIIVAAMRELRVGSKTPGYGTGWVRRSTTQRRSTPKLRPAPTPPQRRRGLPSRRASQDSDWDTADEADDEVVPSLSPRSRARGLRKKHPTPTTPAAAGIARRSYEAPSPSVVAAAAAAAAALVPKNSLRKKKNKAAPPPLSSSPPVPHLPPPQAHSTEITEIGRPRSWSSSSRLKNKKKPPPPPTSPPPASLPTSFFPGADPPASPPSPAQPAAANAVPPPDKRLLTANAGVKRTSTVLAKARAARKARVEAIMSKASGAGPQPPPPLRRGCRGQLEVPGQAAATAATPARAFLSNLHRMSGKRRSGRGDSLYRKPLPDNVAKRFLDDLHKMSIKRRKALAVEDTAVEDTAAGATTQNLIRDMQRLSIQRRRRQQRSLKVHRPTNGQSEPSASQDKEDRCAAKLAVKQFLRDRRLGSEKKRRSTKARASLRQRQTGQKTARASDLDTRYARHAKDGTARLYRAVAACTARGNDRGALVRLSQVLDIEVELHSFDHPYNDFDIILDHLSRSSHRYTTRHTPCGVPYVLQMRIGC